ncbi:MAG: hypothetical protein ACYSX0_22360 [Planctomycetota bacterium]|jgi:hypothetical protein
MRRGAWYWSILFAAVLLGAVLIVWQLSVLIGDQDHELRVYSHDGRWVTWPSCVLPSPRGGPADFVSVYEMGLIQIPADLAERGRDIHVTGPGCGLLSTEFRGEHRITLPPPIRVTIRVPGNFRLPSGDHGVFLEFRASGVNPEIASVLNRAPAALDYLEMPEFPVRFDNTVWLDPVRRSASALLPCAGEWRIVWTHTSRLESGERPTLGLLALVYALLALTARAPAAIRVLATTLNLTFPVFAAAKLKWDFILSELQEVIL